MSVDTIGDFLTIIRNGVLSSKRKVEAPYSRLKHEIARILKDEGFIKDFQVIDLDGNKKQLAIALKYVYGESVIHQIDRVSKPGRRAYASHSGIKPVIGGLGISIVTTNQGVMTSKGARMRNVGGEVLCTVW
jgi:small subunit ribosomal protein S8